MEYIRPNAAPIINNPKKGDCLSDIDIKIIYRKGEIIVEESHVFNTTIFI